MKLTMRFSQFSRARELSMFIGTIPINSRVLTVVKGERSRGRMEERMFEVEIGETSS